MMDITREEILLNGYSPTDGSSSGYCSRERPILHYRIEFGKKLFDKIAASHSGEAILRALNYYEANSNSEQLFFDVLVAEDNVPDDLHLVSRAISTSERVKIYPESSTFPGRTFRDGNNALRILENVKSLPIPRDYANFITYHGMFYGRETSIQVHYFRSGPNIINCSARLLTVLRDEAIAVLDTYKIVWAIRHFDPRNFSKESIDYRSRDLTPDEEDNCRAFPVQIDRLILRQKLALVGPLAKKLLRRRVVEFNRRVVSFTDENVFEDLAKRCGE